MLLARSLVFDAVLYALMGVMGILGAPLALWSVDGAYAVCRAYCRAVFFCLRVICGLRVEVRGAVPAGEVLVASKHQSFLDILILFEALPRAKFIMKKELQVGADPRPLRAPHRLDAGQPRRPLEGDEGDGRACRRGAGAAAARHLSAGDAGGARRAAAVQGGGRGALRPDGRALRAGGHQCRGLLGPAQPLPAAGAGGGRVPRADRAGAAGGRVHAAPRGRGRGGVRPADARGGLRAGGRPGRSPATPAPVEGREAG